MMVLAWKRKWSGACHGAHHGSGHLCRWSILPKLGTHISWAATSEAARGKMHEDGDNNGGGGRGWAIGIES